MGDVKRVYHGVSRVYVVWRSKVDAIKHEGQGIDGLRAGDKLNQDKSCLIQCLNLAKCLHMERRCFDSQARLGHILSGMPLWMTWIMSTSLVKMPAPNLIASPSTTVRPMPRTMLSCKANKTTSTHDTWLLLQEKGWPGSDTHCCPILWVYLQHTRCRGSDSFLANALASTACSQSTTPGFSSCYF